MHNKRHIYRSGTRSTEACCVYAREEICRNLDAHNTLSNGRLYHTMQIDAAVSEIQQLETFSAFASNEGCTEIIAKYANIHRFRSSKHMHEQYYVCKLLLEKSSQQCYII